MGARCPARAAVHSRGHRHSLLSSEVDALRLLDKGGLVASNAHCRLVVGPRGVGKSSALQHLAYANALAHPNTVSVYADLKLYPHPSRISQLVLEAIGRSRGGSVDTPRDGESVLAYLGRIHLHVFLVLDEAQRLWEASEADATAAAQTIANLYGSDAGLIHVVMAGSTVILRALAFRHVNVHTLASKYKVVYEGHAPPSLNSTRFIPAQFHAPRTEREFMAVLQFWWTQLPAAAREAATANLCRDADDDGGGRKVATWDGDCGSDRDSGTDSDEEAAMLDRGGPRPVLPDLVSEWPDDVLLFIALFTAGNFRALSRCTRRESRLGSWMFDPDKPLDHVAPIQHVLQAIYDNVHRTLGVAADDGDGGHHDINPWDTLLMVPLAAVQECMKARGGQHVVDVANVLTWADQRLIMVDTVPAVPELGFVRPADYVFLCRNLRHFSLYDMTVLRFPDSKCGVEAEWWAMYGLAFTKDPTVRSLFDKCTSFDHADKYNSCVFRLPGAAHKTKLAHQRKAARAMANAGTGVKWLALDGHWHMMKESQDSCAGIVVVVRGVVVDGNGENAPTRVAVDIVRCQVKLGTTVARSAQGRFRRWWNHWSPGRRS